VHNGFLKIDGEKMSKSLNNFKSVKDLLDEGWTGMEIRFALLNTHYRKPLLLQPHLLETSRLALIKFNKVLQENSDITRNFSSGSFVFADLPKPAKEAILNNINITKFTAIMHSVAKDIKNTNDLPNKTILLKQLYDMGLLIGIFN
jgi:cysteinyl-tRNA synthetase